MTMDSRYANKTLNDIGGRRSVIRTHLYSAAAPTFSTRSTSRSNSSSNDRFSDSSGSDSFWITLDMIQASSPLYYASALSAALQQLLRTIPFTTSAVFSYDHSLNSIYVQTE